MTSNRKINIASEKILYYSYIKFASLLKRDWDFGYVVFYFLDKNTFMSTFFDKKIVYNKIARSIDYLNRCKVLYVYVDITVSV